MQDSQGVARRDAEIRELHESLSLATSKARDSSRALLAVVRKLCATFEWGFGEVWVPSRDGSALKPGPAWPRANPTYHGFRMISRRLGFRPGQCVPGRVWSERTPLEIADLSTDEAAFFTRRKAAVACGFRSLLAVPILSGDEAVAVIVLYRTTALEGPSARTEAITRAVAPLGPVIARKRVEVELAIRERQQKAVASLGLHALNEATDLERILGEATRVAAATLGVGHCKLLELLPGHDAMVLRAGIGWREGLVGTREVSAGKGSQSGYTILSGKPVIVPDLDRERRFTPSRLLTEHSIVSGLSVIVHGHQGPFGVLAVHAQQRRSFTADDVHFLQSVANVVGTALERREAEEELDEHRRHLETLVLKRTTQLEKSHERLRLAERLASIGTLAAGLGHDLGNTVLPLLCRLDSLDANDLPQRAREDLAAVREAVEYLRQLSQGLRHFALDPEDDTASPRVTSIPEWWATVRSLLRNALPARVELDSRLSDDLPPVVVPAHRLTQAVLNLVANAAEAIEGEGRVRIFADAPRDAGFVRLGVVDNGRGMKARTRRHALEPFFTTKKRGLSTGLGLALVHGVARSCGGEVEIQSAEKQGTMVTLTIPVANRAPDPETTELQLGANVRVAVSLADPRISAYASLLIRSAGGDVEDSPDTEPGDVQVWVTEPGVANADAIRDYLGDDVSRRVILVGDGPGSTTSTTDPRVIMADRRGGPEAMRRSLRQVIFQLLDHSSHELTDTRPLRG